MGCTSKGSRSLSSLSFSVTPHFVPWFLRLFCHLTIHNKHLWTSLLFHVHSEAAGNSSFRWAHIVRLVCAWHWALQWEEARCHPHPLSSIKESQHTGNLAPWLASPNSLCTIWLLHGVLLKNEPYEERHSPCSHCEHNPAVHPGHLFQVKLPILDFRKRSCATAATSHRHIIFFFFFAWVRIPRAFVLTTWLMEHWPKIYQK